MSRMSQTRPARRVRRQFNDEFKAGAIRLVLEESKTVGAASTFRQARIYQGCLRPS